MPFLFTTSYFTPFTSLVFLFFWLARFLVLYSFNFVVGDPFTAIMQHYHEWLVIMNMNTIIMSPLTLSHWHFFKNVVDQHKTKWPCRSLFIYHRYYHLYQEHRTIIYFTITIFLLYLLRCCHYYLFSVCPGLPFYSEIILWWNDDALFIIINSLNLTLHLIVLSL